MTSEPSPQYVWVFPPPRRRPARAWLIGLLAAVAIGIACAVMVFLLPHSGRVAQVPTTASPSQTPTLTPSASASPAQTPTVAPSPPEDAELSAFRDQVSGRLDDAMISLDVLDPDGGNGVVAAVERLRADAQRLTDTTAPAAIATDWEAAVAAYRRSLDELRDAARNGPVSTDAAWADLQLLRTLAGL